MCSPAPHETPEVRMRFDARGGVVDFEIETSRANSVVAAVVDVARDLNVVIERLELRPGYRTLNAHILVASDHGALNAHEQQMLMGAVLEAARTAVAQAA